MDVQGDRVRKDRLIVLLPEDLAGNLDLARSVHRMANREQRDVLYVVLLSDEENIFSVSRSLATMKAITGVHGMMANAKLLHTGNWLEDFHKILLPGDRILCIAEQSIRAGWLRTIPIDQYLRQKLMLSVDSVAGFYHPAKNRLRYWLAVLLTWLGFLTIVIGFAMLEIEVDQTMRGFAHTALLMIVVGIEIGAVWALSSLTDRYR